MSMRTMSSSHRSQRAPIAAAILFVGCAAHPDAGVRIEPAIYGDDDRVEAIDHPDPDLVARARQSVVALVRGERWASWRLCDELDVGPDAAPDLIEDQELCDTERFATQPVGSSCSATLIDVDLVITAAHCVPDDAACASMRIVLGYELDGDGSVRAIPRSDVHACRRRIEAPDGLDVVMLELDRPVAATYRPAPIAATPVAPGDPLRIIGFPLGIPMKIADGCEVISTTSDGRFRSDCDAFPGNSGSGVFNEANELVGIHSSGPGSVRPRAPGECKIYTVYTQDGRLEGVTDIPQLSNQEPVGSTIDALCAETRPGALCGDDSSCGDGICSSDETVDGCALDCDAPVCGDGVCDPGEDFSCVPDCGERDRATECGSGGDAGVDAGADTVDAAVTDAEVPDAATRVDAAIADAGMVAELDAARADAGRAAADGGASPADGSSGCSCRVGRRASAALPAGVTILVVLAGARAARRRARRSLQALRRGEDGLRS
jgi:hypothetical protein